MIHRVPPAVGDWFDGRTSLNRVGRGVLAAGALTVLLAVLAVAGGSKLPGGLGALLLVIVLGAIIVTACFRYPALAVVVMLGAMFLRLSLPHLVVADPFVIAYAVVLVGGEG